MNPKNIPALTHQSAIGSVGSATDMHTANNDITAKGLHAESVNDLKPLMRSAGSQYEKSQEEVRPGGQTLKWLLSR